MDEVSAENDYGGGGGGDEGERVGKMKAEIRTNGKCLLSTSDDRVLQNGVSRAGGDDDWTGRTGNDECDVTSGQPLNAADTGSSGLLDENHRMTAGDDQPMTPDVTDDLPNRTDSSDTDPGPSDTTDCSVLSVDVEGTELISERLEVQVKDVEPQLPLKGPPDRTSSGVAIESSNPIYDVPRSLRVAKSTDECNVEDATSDIYDMPAKELEDSEDDGDVIATPAEPDCCVITDESENVYEEIRRLSCDRRIKTSTPLVKDESIFKRCSLVDEVMDEVERVQQKHDQVLQELNLDIENLIMPVSPMESTPATSPVESTQAMPSSQQYQQPPRVPPHATQVNASGYGYSASSGQPLGRTSHANRLLPPLPIESDDDDEHGYSHRKSSLTAVLKDGERFRRTSTETNGQRQSTPPSSGVKNWLSRLPSLSSFREKKPKGVSSSSDRLSWRWSFGCTEGPFYMLYDDSHRVHEGSKYNSEDVIYEDIDRHGSHQTLPTCTSGSYTSFTKAPTGEHSRERKVSLNNGSVAELSDDRSDTESLRSVGTASVSSFKGRILNLGKKLGRHHEDRMKDSTKNKLSEIEAKPESKLAKLFGKRKGYEIGRLREKSVHLETPEDERFPQLLLSSHHLPATLPPPPSNLTSDQIKRRYIVGTLVHSENSYISSLKRLMQDYQKPLQACVPPIVNASKIATLFHQVPEVLQIHIYFAIALGNCVFQWDREEKIGDVFINTFSKTTVLDAYSEFINNFASAMELAKQEATRKTAFTDFLKVKQITSHDRLSFFGLMVKPVQRFPQFILLLQDLLRHTPAGHHDRLSLQLALTQMEMLAEMLNERKRESDQARAVRSILGHVSAKSTARSLSEGTRYLLRQDTLTQLMFNHNGQLTKFKDRCLFLLNDLLVCVNVSTRSSDDKNKSKRYSMKWAVPVSEVEVQEDAAPILNRMVYAMATGQSSATKGAAEEIGDVQSLYQDLNDLIHDFEVISRISSLVSTLRRDHEALSMDMMHHVSQSVQQAIQEKDEEVKWLDSCCLQLTVPLKTKTGKIQRDLVIFQTKSMDLKQEWLTDVRLAQLALDASNSTAWDFPDQEKRPSTKVPLFVKAVPVLSAHVQMEVKCGCYHKTVSSRVPLRPQNFVWLCSTDGFNCHISVHTLRQMGIREVFSFDLLECRISAMESVPGFEASTASVNLHGDSVWMGTESRRVVVYCGGGAENFQEVSSASMSASVLHIKYHLGQVYVALANGTVAVFKRSASGEWQMKNFQVVTLGLDPVTCLLPVNSFIYCGCGRQVFVLDSATAKIVHTHSVHHDHLGSIYTMAHSGIGLWLNLRNTPLVCLYHAETFQHLQDINVTSSVKRVITEESRPRAPRNIYVTVLTASWGLLWVGTNVGIVLSIPLPRLQGMPMLGRKANMAYHAHVGPVSMILVLQSPPSMTLSSQTTASSGCTVSSAAAADTLTDSDELNRKERTGGEDDGSSEQPDCESNSQTADSLGVFYRGDSLSNLAGGAKTLPRSWRPPPSRSLVVGEAECDVYGLYGDLLNVKEDSSMTPLDDDLRRSDPELIPSMVSTLDRRLRFNSGRPRSLDFTNITGHGGGGENVVYGPSSGSEDGSSAAVSFGEIPETLVEEPSSLQQVDAAAAAAAKQAATAATTVSVKAATNETKTKESTSNNNKKKGPAQQQQQASQRSLLTMIGGRGYVDLRPSSVSTKNRSIPANTQNDAFIIMWEMKV